MRENSEFTMKTIMVAIDFSEASLGALNYAKQLARCFSAKILLVHVIDDMRATPWMEQPKSSYPQLMDSAEEALRKVAAGLSYDVARYATIVRVGSVGETIAALIGERDPDVLVIGWCGKGYKDGEGLGSVAEALLRTVPCPVLTVGKYVRQDAREGTHMRSVLFPTDFSRISRVALAYTESLTKHLAGHLLLLHVDENEVDAKQHPGHQEEFQTFVKGLKDSSVVTESITRTGRPADVIVAVSTEKRVDFIVMGVHRADQTGKAHNDGLAYEVIRSAKCPVLTLFAQPEREMTEAEEFRRQQERLSIRHS
jgi:nucleotide-binding universal stress UspA family protein